MHRPRKTFAKQDQSQGFHDQKDLEQVLSQNATLKGQLMNMSLINELMRVLHSCTDLEGIIKTVLLGIQEIIGFDRAVLFSIDKENFRLYPESSVGTDDRALEDLTIPLGFEGGEITDAIFLNRHLLVDQPDKNLDPFHKHLGSTSYLVMPLPSKATRRCYEVKDCTLTSCPAHGGHNPYCWSIPGAGQALGSVSEDDKRRECIKCACFRCEGVFWMDKAVKGGSATSDDIGMLSAIINVAGLIIENFRISAGLERANTELQSTNEQLKVVNHDLQIAQSKINADLDRAHKIQLGLLPQDLTGAKDFSLGAHYIPATAVGGDYYDVFQVAPDLYGIVVADVSGHGISSALIMSMVKVLLKSFASKDLSPKDTLERINKTFLTEIKSDNFVTIFYALVDTSSHSFSHTSAGHCPILILNKDTRECRQIKADGLFLGVFEDMMLEDSSSEYVPKKTRAVLYTDGLIEGRNAEEEMYDVSRLEKAAVRTLSRSPQEAINAIIKEHREFCGKDKEPEDDITLLVIDL